MKIRNIEDIELKTQLTDSIKLALEFNSQNADASDIEKLTNQFVGALKSKFKEMELKDVKKAILNGLYSGDYTWINARILVTWTKQRQVFILEQKRFVE